MFVEDRGDPISDLARIFEIASDNQRRESKPERCSASGLIASGRVLHMNSDAFRLQILAIEIAKVCGGIDGEALMIAHNPLRSARIA